MINFLKISNSSKNIVLFVLLSVISGQSIAHHNSEHEAEEETKNSRQSTIANKGFADCQDDFYQENAPTYSDKNLLKNSYPLCFNGFAVMYSGKTKTPIWSAEHLSKSKITRGSRLERKNNFHEEMRIPDKYRANVSDYSSSGYDRGHLAPNANMATKKEQYDSFSLANIAPQSPYLNRGTWKKLESSVRSLTKKHGETYTVTGILFKTKKPATLPNNLAIPTHFFKAVYIPKTEQSGVYIAPNDESGRLTLISLDEFATYSNMNIMPALPKKVTKLENLPTDWVRAQSLDDMETMPQASKKNENSTDKAEDKNANWLGKLLSAIFSWLLNKL